MISASYILNRIYPLLYTDLSAICDSFPLFLAFGMNVPNDGAKSASSLSIQMCTCVTALQMNDSCHAKFVV